MCKGTENGRCKNIPTEEIASFGATKGSSSTSCELCGLQASLYCHADNAYLCRKCDKWVHEANFLALRHVRCFLCKTCQNLTQRYLIGASVEVVLPVTARWIVQKKNLPNNNTDRYCSRTQNLPFTFL
ncbi:B-box domain protein 30-like [Abrus precatorius]|uniref:B-box domain protein 30-like n=1 Tax=Abrus precatorius TaxID=3816 RepID=A0A8B8KW92_ABRPR|nr:B-box domain protein 30-like [Abrus precatorius]